MSLRTYNYSPYPHGVDDLWASAAHVHHYLICNADERARIMTEAQSMEPGQPFSVYITHPCLRKHLFLSTVETDVVFLERLTRHFIGDLNTWYYQLSIALVSSVMTGVRLSGLITKKSRTTTKTPSTSPPCQHKPTIIGHNRMVLTTIGEFRHKCITT